MKRSFAPWAALLLLAWLSGCSACQSPFDYCAPVTSPSGCQNCDFGARTGSIFAPVGGIPATAAVYRTPSKAPAAEPSQESPNASPEPRSAKLDADDTETR